MLLFIWANSLAGSQASNAMSGWVESWLKPLVDPQDRIPAKSFDRDVRKAAHAIEYALLGALLAWSGVRTKRINARMLLFAALAAAVIDETIQLHTGRTSQVQDIWIDLSGAVLGMLLAHALLRRKRAHAAPLPGLCANEPETHAQLVTGRRRVAVVALALVILANIIFIWWNSLQSRTESQTLSLGVLQVLRPLLETVLPPERVTDHLIRKLAHFTEFGTLGAGLALLAVLLRRETLRAAIDCLLAGLAVALIDETIQIFTQRGSQVSDVLIDFAGAATGIAAVFAVRAIATAAANARRPRS